MLRYALRAFWKNPGFTAAAVLTLAVGIGMTTAMFSVVDAVLIKPLPYPAADRVVMLLATFRGGGGLPGVSAPKFNEWRRSTDAFEDAAAYLAGGVMNLTDRVEPEQIDVARVSADFFALFGARVVQGRTFTAAEDLPNGPRVVVVSHEFWRRQMGASRSAVGEALSLDGSVHRVIGVLEPEFDARSLMLAAVPSPEVWLPLQLSSHSSSDAPLFVAARLREGTTLDVARTQTAAAVLTIRRAFPSVMPAEAGLTVEPLQTVLVREVRQPLLLLFAAVGFVLLIVCANVANLVLVRGFARQREIAIRLAAGATRGQIVRQLLSESLLLAGAGGGLGLLLAVFGPRALFAAETSGLPRVIESAASAVPWRVFAFSIVVSTIAAVVFGLVPAWRASRVDLDAALRAADGRGATSARSNRLGAWCVGAEIALALTLLIGSALLIRGFMTLRGVNPGFETHQVLTMRTAVTGPRFATVDATAQVVAAGLARAASHPGVEAAAATLTGAPLSGAISFLNITIPGRALDGPYFGGGYLGGWQLVSPRYFDVFRIPLVAGRAFTESDRKGTVPVVIINQTMAKQFWPDSSPIGSHIAIGQGAGPDFEDQTPRQIVGVAGDVRHVGLQFDVRPTVYVPLAQASDNQMAFFNRIGMQLTWIVRTDQDPARAAIAIRNELRQAIGGLPLAGVRTMDDLSAASTAWERFVMALMTIFAAFTVLLASVGVFGVMAYSVRQRAREIGIRVALGADAASVRDMVLGQGMRVAIAGVIVGTLSALALARLLQGIMAGVKPYDATVFFAMPLLLTAVAFAATWLPARRAARLDPIVTLRE